VREELNERQAVVREEIKKKKSIKDGKGEGEPIR